MASPETALERAEELAERLLPDRTPEAAMLVIVNPYATTVSDRLRNLVVYALQGRATRSRRSTPRRRTTPPRSAARPRDEGYDVVVAFGGDGTVNEVANGLAGTDVRRSRCCPAARPTSWARTLGIPNDVVDATEHLLRMADEFEPAPRRPRPGQRAPLRLRLRRRARRPVVERVDATRGARRRSAPGTTATPRSRSSTAATSCNPPRVRVTRRRPTARGRHGRSSRTPTPSPTSASARSASARGWARRRHALVAVLRKRARRSSCRR